MNAMKRGPTVPADFRAQFTARVKLAREDSGLSQGAIAKELGLAPRSAPNKVAREAYAKYENRATLLPHHLLIRFCEITDTSLVALLTHRRPRAAKSATARPSARALKAAR
jgi:transcriptional regulator with XRE-family HTH domain